MYGLPKVSCYDCAYRYTPPGYLSPRSGKDFPGKECPEHSGQHEGQCRLCNAETIKPQYWPCPNGCTDPKARDSDCRYTRCTVFPPRRTVRSGERCTNGGHFEESVLREANPLLRLDLMDSASIFATTAGSACALTASGSPSMDPSCSATDAVSGRSKP